MLNKNKMNIDKLIDDAIESYDAYLRYCNHLAVEAQRYIDFDDYVS